MNAMQLLVHRSHVAFFAQRSCFWRGDCNMAAPAVLHSLLWLQTVLHSPHRFRVELHSPPCCRMALGGIQTPPRDGSRLRLQRSSHEGDRNNVDERPPQLDDGAQAARILATAREHSPGSSTAGSPDATECVLRLPLSGARQQAHPLGLHPAPDLQCCTACISDTQSCTACVVKHRGLHESLGEGEDFQGLPEAQRDIGETNSGPPQVEEGCARRSTRAHACS